MAKPDSVRITSAAVSPREELARRQRNYLISMSLRTVCFVGAVIAGMAGINWLWPFLIGAALILPYVAVVAANAVHTRTEAPLTAVERSLGSSQPKSVAGPED
ncbi:MAG: DUF3099 domain-containing protein [Nocardioides sp.]